MGVGRIFFRRRRVNFWSGPIWAPSEMFQERRNQLPPKTKNVSWDYWTTKYSQTVKYHNEGKCVTISTAKGATRVKKGPNGRIMDIAQLYFHGQSRLFCKAVTRGPTGNSRHETRRPWSYSRHNKLQFTALLLRLGSLKNTITVITSPVYTGGVRYQFTSGYVCVICWRIPHPNLIHKIFFGGNNQNIVYWKLPAFLTPT